MIKVKVSVHHPNWPFTKQTPGKADHIWKDKYQFFINQEIEECDFWIVMNDLKVRNSTIYSETCLCPPQNTIFLPEEPPSIRRYTDRFMRQFQTVFTCHENVKHPNVIQSQLYLQWFIGRKLQPNDPPVGEDINFDFLEKFNPETKPKTLSIITSSKAMTRGHRDRIAFATQLKAHFKDKIDVFGLDKAVSKWQPIADYKYHIAIENSVCKDYWSEKIADSYLGMAFPIYHGCPNVGEFFDERSFAKIDIYNLKESIQTIEKVLSEDAYNTKLPLLKEMKSKILYEYNFFALLEQKFAEADFSDKQQLTIYNERHFDTYLDVAQRRIRRWVMRNF